MNLNKITVLECEQLSYFKNIRTVINNGEVTAFEKIDNNNDRICKFVFCIKPKCRSGTI